MTSGAGTRARPGGRFPQRRVDERVHHPAHDRGVENYVATLKLTPVTDGGRTFAEWWAEFDCAPEREAALAEQIGQGMFQAALDSLKKVVAR